MSTGCRFQERREAAHLNTADIAASTAPCTALCAIECRDYSAFLQERGEKPINVARCASVEEVLRRADVVSLHCVLDASTTHLINKERLEMMKPDAVLINAARGPGGFGGGGVGGDRGEGGGWLPFGRRVLRMLAGQRGQKGTRSQGPVMPAWAAWVCLT